MPDLAHWTPPPRPKRIALEGRFARLEPLDPVAHGDDLFAAHAGEAERHRYLFEDAPTDRAAFQTLLQEKATLDDPLWFAVIDRRTGRAEGRQTLMRIDTAHGVIETGSIFWGPAIARSAVTTEAFFLHAAHVFALGYRRYEWKCNALNAPSRRAALRFGFTYEGTFRQHMVVKGLNRDTAWFAMTDGEWEREARVFAAWLDGCGADGQQSERLEDVRTRLDGET